MKLPRRRQFLHLAAGAAALPAVRGLQGRKPIRRGRCASSWLSAGGAPDIVARLMGQWLSERLGQQFVIENRPGAGSNIAAEAVVRAPPDGYTLLLIISTNAINATLYDKLNFDFIRDIAPVASIGRTPFVMVVNPSFRPSRFRSSSPTPRPIRASSIWHRPATGPHHVPGELFKMMAGVNMVHVPYRGGAA